jgi:hypothetical protein
LTDDTVTPVDMDLDTFSKQLFEPENPAETDEDQGKEGNKVEESDENVDDADATVEDEDAEKGETPDEDEDLEDEEPKEEPKPKGKQSAKDRIEGLYATTKAQERELAQLRRELEVLKTPKNEVDEKPLRESLPADAPDPDALKEDGSAVYPLGEFDKLYIRDLTKYTLNQERAMQKEEEAREGQKKMVEAAQAEIKAKWTDNVLEVEKELPDLREKIVELTETFETLDPTYGEFLASSIMDSDYGPQIMYYLSQNIGEAQKIVASGPAAATRALGRLEAKFEKPEAEPKSNKKLTDAPEPVKANTRGRGVTPSVAGDTHNLAAFEREFYK